MKIHQIKFFYQLLIFAFGFAVLCCAPKEPVIFKGVNNIIIDMSEGKPVLKADISFFNPNKMKMKLKDIDVAVLIDDVKSAKVKHPINIEIPAQSDFLVPITAQLNLKDGGLLNTVFGLLGGKKYEVIFTGNIRIGIHGIVIKVPVMQKQEIKLR
jgi:LEA14-like dessication related protein